MILQLYFLLLSVAKHASMPCHSPRVDTAMEPVPCRAEGRRGVESDAGMNDTAQAP